MSHLYVKVTPWAETFSILSILKIYFIMKLYSLLILNKIQHIEKKQFYSTEND